jgi:hypothetical protein
MTGARARGVASPALPVFRVRIAVGCGISTRDAGRFLPAHVLEIAFALPWPSFSFFILSFSLRLSR